MKPKQEPPRIFKLLDDFITAQLIIDSFSIKQPSETFENKIRTTYTSINDQLDIELDKICDQAPPITLNESGTD